MPNLFLERSIEIAAPSSEVWRVFTDPALSRKMGGEYVSKWEAGSTIDWKGPDGKLLKSGKILKIETERLLKHNAFQDLEGVPTLSSVITYELRWHGETTTLLARESFVESQGDAEFADAATGWEVMLAKIKAVAEE